MSIARNLWLGVLAFAVPIMMGSPPAAAQQQQKPNILFIMGDDIGWMQPSIYHRGLMVGETPNIDRIGNEGAIMMDYYAEQSCTAGRNAFFTGMHPLRTGMIPPQLPGSPSYLRPGTPAVAKFLIDLGYNTGEFGKNHLGDHTDALPTAHGFQEFWGYLYHLDAMQGVSFPDINKSPDTAGYRAALPEHADPGHPRGSRSGGPEDHDLSDASAQCPVVQILQRHVGRTRAARIKARSRWTGQRRLTRKSRPRSSTSSTATIPRRPASLSSSGTTPPACTSRPSCRTSTWRWWVSPAARIGASMKPG